MIMFDRIWEMLESISAGERRKAFDAIVELLSFSKDEEMLQLRDDLIAFEEDITDESEDPIKSLLENTYTKKEAAEALKVSEKTIQRAVSEGLIMPVNPGKKPLRFSVGDLRILYGNPIEKEKESKGLITQYWLMQMHALRFSSLLMTRFLRSLNIWKKRLRELSIWVIFVSQVLKKMLIASRLMEVLGETENCRFSISISYNKKPKLRDKG